MRKNSVLSKEQIYTLCDYALNFEKIFNNSIDLEWAIDGKNHTWILQIGDAQ